MSSISGIGASQSWALQQTNNTQRPSGPPPQGPPPGMQDAIESAAQDAGLDSSEISDLFAKLEETAESMRSSGGDPEEMKAAMDSVLQEAGIDVDALHEQLSSMMASRGDRGSGDEGSAEEATSADILEMLRNLPVGSLYDSEA